MSTGILIGPATKWVGLHHRNETRLDLEIFSSGVNLGSGWDLASRQSRVITECLWAIALGPNNDAMTGSTAESDLRGDTRRAHVLLKSDSGSE